jgi:hypothetical protein
MAKAKKPVQRAGATRNRRLTIKLNNEARALIAAQPKPRADKAAWDAFALHVEQTARRIAGQPSVSAPDILTLAVATSVCPRTTHDLLRAILFKAGSLRFNRRGLNARLVAR